MPDVLVRPWSEKCYAAYLDLGQRYPVFVGVEATADEAREWGRRVLADEDGSLENRCGASDPGGVLTRPNDRTMGKSKAHNRIGRAGAVNTRTPDLTSMTGRLPQ
jgi:hypothetical protein